MEKSKIVNHFQKEGYPRQIIYNTMNHMQLGRTINDKNENWPPNLLDTCQNESAQKISQ